MSAQFPDELSTRIYRAGAIAVLVVDRVEDAVPLARALLAGGIDVMELTLRTPAAIDALCSIRAEVREMLAGIGTILQPQQVRDAAAAGAAFGVAPGMNPRVVGEARRLGLPFAPGIVTPSDIEQALQCDCRLLKFFPAEPAGGLRYLKAIAAPYAHADLRYIPLGGLTLDDLERYLADPLVHAVGGSWLAPRDLIQARDWPQITENVRRAAQIVRKVRG
jgi:2-dehydro-3-deoxyphosphogluconate aldolase/(4S)-4-hydroxy-2-oxoglutarate aldolase